jgi:hypothetical protein
VKGKLPVVYPTVSTDDGKAVRLCMGSKWWPREWGLFPGMNGRWWIIDKAQWGDFCIGGRGGHETAADAITTAALTIPRENPR